MRATLAPCALWVREGQTYGVRCDGAELLAIGRERVRPTWPGLFSWTARNAVGRASLRAMRGGRCVSRPLEVEVVAARFDAPEQQWRFVRAVTAVIEREQQLDPFRDRHFEWSASREGALSLDALIDALDRDGDALLEGLAAVRAQPASSLATDAARVLVATNAAAIDALEFASADGAWDSRAGAEQGRRGLRGRAPREAWGTVTASSFDCPENRWLRAELTAVIEEASGAAFDRLLDARPARARLRARTTLEALRRALDEEPLRSATDSATDPSRARAMCDRREPYASVARWIDGAGARSTLRWPHARHAASLRDAATLYEMYCFFALARAIGAALGEPVRFSAAKDKRGASTGLARGAVASIGARHALLYNRALEAYSGALRPDFALLRDGRATLVFDAKMRAVDGEDAARADIDKMHAYRDALAVRAAVCLFPGERSVLYEPSGARHESARIAAIVRGPFEGVGAIALAPEGAL
jgi:hypothetical protein